uniref:E3 ubiquitin-protein ligase RNF19A n=1 Tax=Pristiophorus japonicus TaxID=55135 RepID=UPI00398EE4A2
MKRPNKHRQLQFFSLFSRKPKSKSKLEMSTVTVEGVHTKTESEDEKKMSSTNRTTQSSSNEQLLGTLECPLCLLSQPRSQFPEIISCHHRSCLECLQQYLKIEITESRVNVACPECSELFHPSDIRMILNNGTLMEKYEEFMLRRYLASDPDARWCPAPDCSYGVIASGCATCPKLTCDRSGCATEFCYHCKQLWHPDQTCSEARKQRDVFMAGIEKHSTSLIHSEESDNVEEIKPCPRCGAFILKMNDGSCNRMTCAVCGCQFCWLCMKEITDLHYLSPSGCTFWGKKPWSRKKKILWQVGMLVGAPVGITLIAGIAVPVMMVGLPIIVGRKIYSRCESNKISKHRRRLAVAGGVVLSIIVSPVLAAVTVGIGVPIMLAYVYGVVPVSLCRSDWCGVTTGNGKGVKIEIDEDAASVNEPRPRLHNHSISGSSVQEVTSGLSASGSNLDRAGVKLENDQSASNVALAGSMLSAEQDSSNREGKNIEVHVDIETEPGGAKDRSSSSYLSVHSLSMESPHCSRELLCGTSPNTERISIQTCV